MKKLLLQIQINTDFMILSIQNCDKWVIGTDMKYEILDLCYLSKTAQKIKYLGDESCEDESHNLR